MIHVVRQRSNQARGMQLNYGLAEVKCITFSIGMLEMSMLCKRRASYRHQYLIGFSTYILRMDRICLRMIELYPGFGGIGFESACVLRFGFCSIENFNIYTVIPDPYVNSVLILEFLLQILCVHTHKI